MPLGLFLFLLFLSWSLAPDLCSARQTSASPLGRSILSDRNIFCTPREGRTTAGYNAPGAFLVEKESLPTGIQGYRLNMLDCLDMQGSSA